MLDSALQFYAITLIRYSRVLLLLSPALKQIESIRLKKSAMLANKISLDESPLSGILSKYNLDNAHWDNLSHFVLRLAYSKTEELRRWLITQESQLFKYRFDSESEDTITQFLKENDLNYQPLDQEELNATIAPEDNDMQDDDGRIIGTVTLRDLLRQVPYADVSQLIYFRVPFEDAIDLLRDRKVFLSAGFAYVSRKDLSAIITTKFRARLSQHLSMTCRATSQMKQDPRIVPLLSMLGKQYINPTYQAGKIEGAVTKEQIPQLADRSFPLCMQTLYSGLKADNHLKHSGRMQFGLFLKGIGLSLADALAFWKQSFARKTPPEKFDKEYAYNIRHNYGKEGKRMTYTPYSCIKIINGVGDGHAGCPFKNWDDSSIRAKMRLRNFTPLQSEEVLTLVKGQHFQIACQRWYQFTHNNTVGDAVGSHPNTYFDVSEVYWRQQEGQEGAAQGTAASAGVRSTAVKTEGYSAFPSSAASSTPSSTVPTSTAESSSSTQAADATQAAPPATQNKEGPVPMET